MQKIIFYQEVQPKAADALWLHHGYDSNGSKKESISIDYIQNGVVRHITAAGGEGVSKIIASEEYNFDTTKTYSTDDLVVKDGLLYFFTSNHAAGEWNENEVRAIDVLSLINALDSGTAYASNAIGRLNGQIKTLQGQVTSLKKALGSLVAGDTLCFTALDANSSIKIRKQGSPSITPSLEYSTDGITWQAYTIGTYIPASSVGDTVYFRSDGTTTTFSESTSKYLYFVMSGRFEASGSVMSLIDKNLEGNVRMRQYCFYHLFANCTVLTTAPELPATRLAEHCYQAMFSDCTSLTTAPELPATTLAEYCYQSMFQNCTALTTAPELPATTLESSCYSYMFNGCTHLSRIKAMFTGTPSASYTSNWVNGVAAEGVFIKNANATWNVTGISGIPSGWTVETASE